MGQAVTWLQAWFANRVPEAVVAESENFFEREAIDSFGVIELIEDIETQFGIRFSNEHFQDRRFPTIDGLALIIEELRSNVGA